jgi:hypothetical protein
LLTGIGILIALRDNKKKEACASFFILLIRPDRSPDTSQLVSGLLSGLINKIKKEAQASFFLLSLRAISIQ